MCWKNILLQLKLQNKWIGIINTTKKINFEQYVLGSFIRASISFQVLLLAVFDRNSCNCFSLFHCILSISLFKFYQGKVLYLIYLKLDQH